VSSMTSTLQQLSPSYRSKHYDRIRWMHRNMLGSEEWHQVPLFGSYVPSTSNCSLGYDRECPGFDKHLSRAVALRVSDEADCDRGPITTRLRDFSRPFNMYSFARLRSRTTPYDRLKGTTSTQWSWRTVVETLWTRRFEHMSRVLLRL
jgi:hypothetical protein